MSTLISIHRYWRFQPVSFCEQRKSGRSKTSIPILQSAFQKTSNQQSDKVKGLALNDKRIESVWLEVSDYVCPCGHPTSGPTLRWILNVATTPLRWCYHKFLSLQLRIWRDFAAISWDIHGCIVLWSMYLMTEHTNVPQMSLFLLLHPLASCLIETFLVWLFCNLWERRHFNLSEMISCCLYRVYTQVKTPGPKVTWVANKGERSEDCFKMTEFNFQMRGVHTFLSRVGGQGRIKRELSTSRWLSSSSSFYDACLLARPCGALFSQLQQSFYSEDQLALQETTKKLVEEVVLCKVMELVADHLLLGRWSTPTPRSGRPREYFPRIKFSKNSARQVFLALTGLEFFLPNEMDNNWEKPSAGNSPLYCR